MITESAVVDTCAKQKTDMEDECPRNGGKPKQPVCIEYEIPKAASEAQVRMGVVRMGVICSCFLFLAMRWAAQIELSEDNLFDQKSYKSRLHYKNQDSR